MSFWGVLSWKWRKFQFEEVKVVFNFVNCSLKDLSAFFQEIVIEEETKYDGGNFEFKGEDFNFVEIYKEIEFPRLLSFRGIIAK